jgi:hypothetical protein
MLSSGWKDHVAYLVDDHGLKALEAYIATMTHKVETGPVNADKVTVLGIEVRKR